MYQLSCQKLPGDPGFDLVGYRCEIVVWERFGFSVVIPTLVVDEDPGDQDHDVGNRLEDHSHA